MGCLSFKSENFYIYSEWERDLCKNRKTELHTYKTHTHTQNTQSKQLSLGGWWKMGGKCYLGSDSCTQKSLFNIVLWSHLICSNLLPIFLCYLSHGCLISPTDCYRLAICNRNSVSISEIIKKGGYKINDPHHNYKAPNHRPYKAFQNWNL